MAEFVVVVDSCDRSVEMSYLRRSTYSGNSACGLRLFSFFHNIDIYQDIQTDRRDRNRSANSSIYTSVDSGSTKRVLEITESGVDLIVDLYTSKSVRA